MTYDTLARLLSKEQIVLYLDTLTKAFEGERLMDMVMFIDYQPSFIRDGPAVEYFSNGRIQRNGEYCKGFKCGDWIESDSSGAVVARKHFLQGVLR